MRSSSMAWLFETIGIQCFILQGGYKSYRRYVKEIMANPYTLNVIGGKTGSGKTAILQQLDAAGQQIVDLEALAHHKGSAFGALGEQEQPSTEQFENDLCRELSGLDPGKEIWIEDESRNVGKCVIPGELYERMKAGATYFLDIPREERARYLVKHYAVHDKQALIGCVQKIHKKLGGDRAREAIESIEQEEYFTASMITLQYYDKAYMHSLEKNHTQVQRIETNTVDPVINTGILLKFRKSRDQKR